ncbi:MAG: LD-carboxypeptidase [Rhodospirillales bacterium]|nr:LD-carboxypeptidase [Rhodospirillales bacterium]
MKFIKPPKLKEGDTIAAVSPSWGGPGTFPHRYEAGKRQFMEAFKVNVVEMPHTMRDADWLFRNPQARADDLMQAFSDFSINGIIATIGGEDSVRLIPWLDFGVIRNNPKIFMGYSDTTNAHLACVKAGLTSFYGPSIMAGFAENGGLFPYMEEAVRKTLFSSDPVGDIPQADGWTVEFLDWANPDNQAIKRNMSSPLGRRVLQGTGTVQGHLMGGCLDVFPMVVGTELWPDKELWQGAILFLETSEEAPPVESVKRWLRNLGAQGIFDAVNGVILGRPGGPVPVDELMRYDAILQKVVAEEFCQPDLPLMTQMDFGHTDPMFVLPYGVQAEIDCENKGFRILECAVS